jgi:hypothetical protein
MCARLHAAAQEVDETTGPERGWRWERRIQRELLVAGFSARSLSPGARLLGTFAASGLRHQVDAEIRCERAFVIGEWKSFSGPIPKNEVLRFKAVSDDYYEAMSDHQRRAAVLRVFGAAGSASLELRRYAARFGIALIERSRWPAAVLSDPLIEWPVGSGPADSDRRRLTWLCRPMQQVMRPLEDGTLLLEAAPSAAAIDAVLSLQERWSARLDDLTAAGFLPYRTFAWGVA